MKLCDNQMNVNIMQRGQNFMAQIAWETFCTQYMYFRFLTSDFENYTTDIKMGRELDDVTISKLKALVFPIVHHKSSIFKKEQ